MWNRSLALGIAIVVVALISLGIAIGLAMRSDVREPPTPEQLDRSARAYYREVCKEGAC